jgi:hypothetical protein
MVAVKAFDAATNRRLNLAKARGFVIQALAKYLKAGKDAQFALRGVQIKESGAEGGVFRLALVIPREGVAVASRGDANPVSAPTKKPTTQKRPRESLPAEDHEFKVAVDSLAADFLNAKSDYLDTIARLKAALCDDAIAAEKKAQEKESFYSAISDLEERAEVAFKSLGPQIDGDKLLLELEREEIRPALKQAHGDVLKALELAVARFDQRQEKPKAKKEKKK